MKEYFDEGKQVSEVCENDDVYPNFYIWKKDFLEDDVSYFKNHDSETKSAENKKLK